MVNVIASNSTYSLHQNLQFLIIGLEHACAKCARLSFLSGRNRKQHTLRKDTRYEANPPIACNELIYQLDARNWKALIDHYNFGV